MACVCVCVISTSIHLFAAPFVRGSVPYETMQNLWTPVIDFTNTKGNHITMTDEEATMVVNMQGRPSLGDNKQPEEGRSARPEEEPCRW